MKNHPKILMYHSIGYVGSPEAGAGLYCVPVEKFREQMLWVSELASYRVSGLNAQPPNPPNPLTITITLDDGLVDNYTSAYPILKELGLKAYFFILVGKAGTDGYMDWKQIRQLRDGGMVIGSHGMTHRILTELNDKELEYELEESRKILEQKLEVKVECLSIPRGFANKKVIAKAKQAGYKAVFTSESKDNDDYCFGRIAVKSSWSIKYFARVLKNGLSFKDKAGELIKNSSKRILGARNYDRVRTGVLGSLK